MSLYNSDQWVYKWHMEYRQFNEIRHTSAYRIDCNPGLQYAHACTPTTVMHMLLQLVASKSISLERFQRQYL